MAKHQKHLDLEEAMSQIEEWESQCSDKEEVLKTIIRAWACLRGEERRSEREIWDRIQHLSNMAITQRWDEGR